MTRPLLAFRDSPIPYTPPTFFRAVVNYVTDADTVWVERDSGCRASDLIELRITGDAWKGFDFDERFTETGKEGTARLKLFTPPGTIIRIETKPDPELYGRWLTPYLIPYEAMLTRLHAATLAELPAPIKFHLDDQFDRGGIRYLSWAEHAVRSLAGGHWKEYK